MANGNYNPFGNSKKYENMTDAEKELYHEQRLDYFLKEQKSCIFLDHNQVQKISSSDVYTLYARQSLKEWHDYFENDSWRICKFMIIDCTDAPKDNQKKVVPMVKDKRFAHWIFEDKCIVVTCTDRNELLDELASLLIFV